METLYGASISSAEEYAQKHGIALDYAEMRWEKYQQREQEILSDAQNAYKTAGMSTNEYMETVNGFAASLTASLGEYEHNAANMANMIVTDMADNANKMGTSMESIKNAYAGFAKGNFTMLDNLKLGYGGTKEEMERLLEKAAEIEGVEAFDINSFADVAQAINIIQTELGITGTTALEASETISGSASAMKASWENLLVGIADDSQDFDLLIDNLVESTSIFVDNILPRVEDVLIGTGELVDKLLPVVVDRIPGIINNVLPKLMTTGMSMVTTLINGIESNLPEIVNGVFLILQQFITTFLGMLPQILEMGLFIIVQLALGIAVALPELVPQIINVMLTIVQVLLDNIDLLIDASIQIIFGLAEGLIQALPVLIERIPEIVIAIMDALIENGPRLLEAAYELIAMLAVGLVTYLPTLLAKIPGLITTILNKFNELVACFDQVGTNIINGIWKGLSAGWNWLVDKVKSLAGSLLDAAKEVLGIHSPSKEFEWIADMCIAGFNNKMDDFMNPNNMTRNIKASLGVMKNNISGGRYEGSSGGYGNVYQNVYVNREVATADELARAIRLESRYGMMRGVPVG